jgi:hypothetical protein
MRAAKSPGAVAALGASERDEPGRHVGSEVTFHRNFAQASIHATLVGSDRCEAEGISAQGASPVLAFCRKLLAGGIDPTRPLLAYRGKVLCLTVQSIAEGARLAVGESRTAFARCFPFAAVSPQIARKQQVDTTHRRPLRATNESIEEM